MRRSTTDNRRGRRGQSLIETALSAPVLFLLLYGLVIVGTLISDRVVSGNAARQGARTASLIGGSLSRPCPGSNCITQAAADQTIVKSVLTVAAGLNYSSVREIDIYPANCTPSSSQACVQQGMYANGDPIDQWGGDDNPLPGGTQTFTMDRRVQVVPNETSMGVRIYYTFTPPFNVGFGRVGEMDFAVMKAAPVID